MNSFLYQNLIRMELSGIYGHSMLQEMDEIIRYYELYEGRRTAEAGDDTSGSPKITRTNWIKKLINDESRHMCARPPELRIMPRNAKADREKADRLTEWLEDTLDRNGWSEQLLKGARDAFVGKRVALKLSYERGFGIRLRFAPSLEFIYDPDDRNPRRVNKAIFFYCTTPETVTDKAKQRYWKQRYVMREGRCILDEGEFDGYGRPVNIIYENYDTGLDFIPAFVIVNGGLSGDLLGESDVQELTGNQAAYDQTKSDDLDALKYQMFGQKVFIDASPESMQSIVIEPNAMIDLQSEPGSPHQAKAQVLETTFAYGEHMTQTLGLLKDDMHEILSIPRITPELLSGLGTSGKAMRALYWTLNCRCEERWSSGWDAALEWMVESMLRLARASGEKLPELDYVLNIEHLYPIMDDDEDERALDLQEVNAQVRSRRAHIEKWQPDADPDDELRQIMREKKLLEDAYESSLLKELRGV